MIDVTNVDLVKFAQAVYELSVPQGLGFMHFTPIPLSDDEAGRIVDAYAVDKHYALVMDYVHGRACKMTVWRKDGRLEIADAWYDHTNKQYADLLGRFGISLTPSEKHSIACNCVECQRKRG